jgi:hypothetical protein
MSSFLIDRGIAEPDVGSLPAADTTALLRACFKLLERARVYRPNPPRSRGCRRRWKVCAACRRACPTAHSWCISCRRQSLPPRIWEDDLTTLARRLCDADRAALRDRQKGWQGAP